MHCRQLENAGCSSAGDGFADVSLMAEDRSFRQAVHAHAGSVVHLSSDVLVQQWLCVAVGSPSVVCTAVAALGMTARTAALTRYVQADAGATAVC